MIKLLYLRKSSWKLNERKRSNLGKITCSTLWARVAPLALILSTSISEANLIGYILNVTNIFSSLSIIALLEVELGFETNKVLILHTILISLTFEIWVI